MTAWTADVALTTRPPVPPDVLAVRYPRPVGGDVAHLSEIPAQRRRPVAPGPRRRPALRHARPRRHGRAALRRPARRSPVRHPAGTRGPAFRRGDSADRGGAHLREAP